MEQGSHWFKKIYYYFIQGENSLRHILLLIVRLYWGVLLMMAGFGKWANIGGVSEFFSSLGIPLPHFSAYFVASLEFLGGLSLIFGLLSRIFSPLIVILFLTAYATAHTEALKALFTNPSLFTTADPFMYLFTALLVLCFGPGMFSFDYWLEKKKFGHAL